MGLADGAGLKWKEGELSQDSAVRSQGRGSSFIIVEGASAHIRQGRAKG